MLLFKAICIAFKVDMHELFAMNFLLLVSMMLSANCECLFLARKNQLRLQLQKILQMN